MLKQLNKLSISLLFGHCFRFHARPFLAEARVKDVISLALTHVKNLKDKEVSKILGQGWDGTAPYENVKFQVTWKRADSEITNISDSFLILYLLRFKEWISKLFIWLIQSSNFLIFKIYIWITLTWFKDGDSRHARRAYKDKFDQMWARSLVTSHLVCDVITSRRLYWLELNSVHWPLIHTAWQRIKGSC